jgi:crotonobetainyl-CoA:carnitine CoA-transferase CaiB-like acyl-CoA transferase
MGALDGIRVLDCSRVLAGPYCGQLLADNGAEVIKVEAPEGDQNRRFPPVVDGEATNFMSVNRGKSGITLNLQVPEGRHVLHALAAKSDVFIQNFLPDATTKLGVDYETLAAINPDLIHVSISGYGARGPLRGRPGYDMMVNAYVGIMGITGEANGPPVRAGVSALDMSSGMLAYGAVVTALLARANGKARGQKIDLSLLETGISLLGYHALNWLIAGTVDQREGSTVSTLVPYGPHRCADGDMLIGAPTEAAWRKLCQVIGAEALTADPRFASNARRCAHAAEVTTALENVLGTNSVRHWVEALDAVGIACAPISTLDQVFREEQVLANDMVVQAPRRDGTTVPLIGLPFKLSATPGQTGHAPPRLGEHTEDVLRATLGLSAQEISALRAAGAF